MQRAIGTLSKRSVDVALAMHRDAVRTYEQAWNGHTFDFEKDIGHFLAPDITLVAGGTLSERILLRDLSDARADYVRGTNAKVTIDLDMTCVADLGTTVVVVADGSFTFTYPDRTAYTQRILASSTLRLLNGAWVFQHIHCGSGCA